MFSNTRCPFLLIPRFKGLSTVLALSWLAAASGLAFEGRIQAAMTRGNESNALVFTAQTNFLRVEMGASDWPNPVLAQSRCSFPHNRSFCAIEARGGKFCSSANQVCQKRIRISISLPLPVGRQTRAVFSGPDCHTCRVPRRNCQSRHSSATPIASWTGNCS
jgi:hypothetical protein